MNIDDIIDWKDLQYSLKQLHVSLTDVQNKEIEMQKEIDSSLNLYYKYKRKNLLIVSNTSGFLGINNTIIPKDRIKVDIKTANPEELYLFGPLKEYLFLFRNNEDNLYRFINFLKENEQKKIAHLLMNFFYEDITLNESSDVLNHIFYKLLSYELCNSCDSTYLDNYINPFSFVSKMCKELINRNEIKIYVAHIISSLINDLEEFSEKNQEIKITLNLEELYQNLKEKNIIVVNNGLSLTKTYVEKDHNTNINFDKTHYKSKSTIKAEDFNFSKEEDTSLSKRALVFGVPTLKKRGIETLSDEKIKKIFEYDYDYSEKTLKNLIKKSENDVYRLIYLSQAKRINGTSNKNKYNINPFREKIKGYCESQKLFTYYYENYKQIKDFITKLISNIIEYEEFLPKLIKTAYRAFSNYLRCYYPNLPKFFLIQFLIDFLFEYVIIPIVKYPELNELLVKHKIFSTATHKNLLNVVKVLRHISRCLFFDEEDEDFKIFNSFIAEQHYLLQEYFNNLIFNMQQEIVIDRDKSESIFDNEIYQTMCLSRQEIIIFLNYFNEMKFPDDKGEFYRMVQDSPRLTEDHRPERFSVDQFFVFCHMNYKGERKQALVIEKKKEKNTFNVPYGEEMLFVENIKNCINYVLVNVSPISNSLNNAAFSVLFQQLNNIINYHQDEYKDIFVNKNIPLSWYSNYIISIMEKLPSEYQKNNYLKLFMEMSNETREKRTKITNKNDVLSIDISSEINSFKKMVKIYSQQVKIAKELEQNAKIVFFINNAKLEVCLINGKERFNDLFELGVKDPSKNLDEIEEKEIIIETPSTCIHSPKESAKYKSGPVTENKLKKLKSIGHAKTVIEFVKRFLTYLDNITADVFSRINDKKFTNKTKADECMEKYINFIDDTLTQKYREYFVCKDEKKRAIKQKDFVKKIQAFILKRVALGLSAQEKSYYIILEDKKFQEKCLRLQWLNPYEHLGIDPSMISNLQMTLARQLIEKMDKERSGTNVIKYFSKAVNLIVKMITFTTSREDISIDDFLPILVYLFISVRPCNAISNFGNATYFLMSDEENENTGYSLANIEGCINFIKKYDETQCGKDGISKEEFNERCIGSYEKYSLTGYLSSHKSSTQENQHSSKNQEDNNNK